MRNSHTRGGGSKFAPQPQASNLHQNDGVIYHSVAIDELFPVVYHTIVFVGIFEKLGQFPGVKVLGLHCFPMRVKWFQAMYAKASYPCH